MGEPRVKLYAESYAKSYAKSNNYRSCDHGVTIAFFSSMSSNKQVIVKKLFAIR